MPRQSGRPSMWTTRSVRSFRPARSFMPLNRSRHAVRSHRMQRPGCRLARQASSARPRDSVQRPPLSPSASSASGRRLADVAKRAAGRGGDFPHAADRIIGRGDRDDGIRIWGLVVPQLVIHADVDHPADAFSRPGHGNRACASSVSLEPSDTRRWRVRRGRSARAGKRKKRVRRLWAAAPTAVLARR